MRYGLFMQDLTASKIDEQPRKFPERCSVGQPLDARVRQLVHDFGTQKSAALIEEMITTALKMGRDEMSVADLKLINRSVKEMRSAAKIFAPFKHLRKVAVFGSARTQSDSADDKLATDFGCEMVRQAFMLITGGSDGIMGAVQRGAGHAHTFGLNIRLPSEQRVNEVVEDDSKLITLNYFFTRKLSFVKEAHAFALFPGGFGTLDEAFEVLTLMQTSKARIVPVVLLDHPHGKYWETWMEFLTERLLKFGFISTEDFAFFKIKHHAQEAASEITQFYKVFHSARWLGERFVIRLNRRLSTNTIVDLNKQFADIVRTGQIVQRAALAKEKNDSETRHLPQLIFTPFRTRFGRFRQLIDTINSSQTT
jgi:uncharacterized protein (TIGR00730 family)